MSFVVGVLKGGGDGCSPLCPEQPVVEIELNYPTIAVCIVPTPIHPLHLIALSYITFTADPAHCNASQQCSSPHCNHHNVPVLLILHHNVTSHFVKHVGFVDVIGMLACLPPYLRGARDLCDGRRNCTVSHCYHNAVVRDGSLNEVGMPAYLFACLPAHLRASEEHENFVTGDGSVTYMLQDMRTPGAILADNPHAKIIFALRWVFDIVRDVWFVGVRVCVSLVGIYLYFPGSSINRVAVIRT